MLLLPFLRKKSVKAYLIQKNHRIESNNGRFFVHWGYNFSSYAKSDIHFKGPGYAFTLHDVKAGDRPSKLSLDYINPARITIPQFNFHFGYFINDNYSISLGWDHMKYVVNTPQSVKFTGYADAQVSDPAIPSGIFGNTQSGDQVLLNPDEFKYEHTDGYNFATVGLERYDDIWVAPSGKMYLTMETGVEAGLIIPRSDVRIFGEGKITTGIFLGMVAQPKPEPSFILTRDCICKVVLRLGGRICGPFRPQGEKGLIMQNRRFGSLRTTGF